MLPKTSTVSAKLQPKLVAPEHDGKKPTLFPLSEVGDSDNEDETLDLQQRIINFGAVSKYDLPQINSILKKYSSHNQETWYVTLVHVQASLNANQHPVKLDQKQMDLFKNKEFSKAVQTTYTHQLVSANRPDITTVRCKSTVIKGAQLVRVCARFEEDSITTAKPTVTLKDASTKQISIEKPQDWLTYGQGFSSRGVKLFQGEKRSAARTDVYANGSMKKRSGDYPYSFEEITMPSGIKLRLDRDNDRLHLDENLTFGSKSIADIVGKPTTDLKYSEIAAVFEHIKKTYKVDDGKGNPIPMDDATIARLQLKLFKCEKVNGLAPELCKWLDFCNVLMFGVEASRFHGGIFTSLMTLELVKKKHLSYAELFSGVELQRVTEGGESGKLQQFGGQFYGATLKAGEDNVRDRQQMLTGAFSMKDVRADPIHYGVLVKEIMTIKNWCGVTGINAAKYEQEEFLGLFTESLEDLRQSYFGF